MRDAAAYREFLSDFLARKVDMFGQVALARARALPGLEIDERGRVVRFIHDPYATVEAVLQTFDQLSGRASYLTVRASLRALRLLERFPGIEIPPQSSPGAPLAAAAVRAGEVPGEAVQERHEQQHRRRGGKARHHEDGVEAEVRGTEPLDEAT
jgi:hypothetical protein